MSLFLFFRLAILALETLITGKTIGLMHTAAADNAHQSFCYLLQLMEHMWSLAHTCDVK